MITRLDEALYARIKEQAAAEGRSVNELVVTALTLMLDSASPRRAILERARAAGWLVVPDPPAEVPSWDEVDALSEEFGTAVSEALEAERSARW